MMRISIAHSFYSAEFLFSSSCSLVSFAFSFFFLLLLTRTPSANGKDGVSCIANRKQTPGERQTKLNCGGERAPTLLSAPSPRFALFFSTADPFSECTRFHSFLDLFMYFASKKWTYPTSREIHTQTLMLFSASYSFEGNPLPAAGPKCCLLGCIVLPKQSSRLPHAVQCTKTDF